MKTFMTWMFSLMLIVSVVLSGCSAKSSDKDVSANSPSNTAKKEKDIVIGAILSTSGDYASIGVSEANALKAFEQTAEPINGRKIRFIIENDQSNPAQASASAKTLVANDEVMGIIGPSVTATMLGTFPVVQPAKIPTVFLSTLPYPNYNKEPYIFGVNLGSIEIQTKAYIDYYKSIGIGTTEFAALANDDASGQAISKIMKAGGITNVFLAPASLTDYTSLLTQLKKQGIKGLVSIQNGTNGGYVRKSQLAIGFDIPLLLGSSTLNPSFLQIAGDAANGVKVLMVNSLMEPSQLSDPNQSKIVADYQKRLKDTIGKSAQDEGIPSAFAWDAALSFYNAFKELKTIDRNGIQKILDQQQYFGAIGEVKRTSNDHSGFQQKSYLIAELKNGKIITSK